MLAQELSKALCLHPVMIVIYVVIGIIIFVAIMNQQQKQKAEEERQTRIYARSDEWGKENCAALIGPYAS